MSSKSIIKRMTKTVDEALKKQVREGFAKSFSELGCKAVADEIKAGRNIKHNVEFGIIHCVHDKMGPQFNVRTEKFIPQSKKAREIERKFIQYANLALKSSGYGPLQPKLLANLRKGDKDFEDRVKHRDKPSWK